MSSSPSTPVNVNISKFDLTLKMTEFLDRHMLIPLLQFLLEREVSENIGSYDAVNPHILFVIIPYFYVDLRPQAIIDS